MPRVRQLLPGVVEAVRADFDCGYRCGSRCGLGAVSERRDSAAVVGRTPDSALRDSRGWQGRMGASHCTARHLARQMSKGFSKRFARRVSSDTGGPFVTCRGRVFGCFSVASPAGAPERPLLLDQSKAITPPASATHFRFGQALAARARCLLAAAAFLARREGAWRGRATGQRGGLLAAA